MDSAAVDHIPSGVIFSEPGHLSLSAVVVAEPVAAVRLMILMLIPHW